VGSRTRKNNQTIIILRVLVTGYKGFIGSNMMKACAAQNWEVDGYDWGDEHLPDIKEYDWVIHLGAIASINETNVEKVLLQNFDFSQWLFNQCNMYGTNLQYASSSSVYGMTNNFSEDAPCYPDSAYAWSKYLFDRWVRKQQKDITVHGFRYFNVYGEGMHLRGDRANVVHKWMEQAKNNGYMDIYEDSNLNKRDFTYVGDVCKLHIDFIKNIKESGIWNCGSGITYTYRDIINAIKDLFVEHIQTRTYPIPNPAAFRKYTCANLTKLEAAIGKRSWTSVIDWIKG